MMNTESYNGRPNHLLRLREVVERLSLSKSHIYALIQKGAFPAAIKIGAVSAWLESEVDAFIVNAVSASRAAA